MKLPRYPKYKDSGVEWLGSVPEHWKINRLKHCVQMVSTRAEEQTNPVALENIESWTGKYAASSGSYEGEGIAFEAGDILFGKLRPYLAKAHLATTSGEAVGDFFVMRPNGIARGDFLVNFILTKPVIDIIHGSSFGAKMPRASWDFLGGIPVPLPSQEEQSLIQQFVNDEVSKVNTLIEKQQRLIDLLKEKRQAVISHAVTKGLNPNVPMKPSGVHGVGDVPEHWRIVRLRLMADVQGGVAKGRDLKGQETIEVPYLRVANVQDGYLDLEEVTTMEIGVNELQRYALQPGDVLMNEGGDFDKLGRGHIWRGEIQNCIHQNHVFAVRPRGVEPEWLNYITSADYARFHFMFRSKQTTNLASISSSNIQELPVICPPQEERLSVIDHIQKLTTKIDALLVDATHAIDLLQERRSALISAAVTGKIDVRGLASTEAA